MVEEIDEDHDDDGDSRAWKRRKRKTKRLKANVISIGPFCFGDQDT